jgi:LytS/YehU family sensor histidine kinase
VQSLLDEASWDLFAVLAADGRTRYVSPSNERLLGYALDENALLHGLRPALRPAQGEGLTVRARRHGDQLRLTVVDTGIGLDNEVGLSGAGDPNDEQVGLPTTRTRLRQVYGTRATLALAASPEGDTVATILLPLPD